MYFLTMGDVEVHVKNVGMVAVLEPPRYFGERAMFAAHEKRSATIRARTVVYAFALSRSNFASFMAGDEGFKTKLKKEHYADAKLKAPTARERRRKQGAEAEPAAEERFDYPVYSWPAPRVTAPVTAEEQREIYRRQKEAVAKQKEAEAKAERERRRLEQRRARHGDKKHLMRGSKGGAGEAAAGAGGARAQTAPAGAARRKKAPPPSQVREISIERLGLRPFEFASYAIEARPKPPGSGHGHFLSSSGKHFQK